MKKQLKKPLQASNMSCDDSMPEELMDAMQFGETRQSRTSANIIWVNRFEEENAREFTMKLFELESRPDVQIIPIFIDSFGGHVDSFLAMYNAMTACRKPIATVCIGKAMSAGAFLLAQGTKGYRFAAEHSRIMIHESASMSYGKVNDLVIEANEISRLNMDVLNLFAKRTKFVTAKNLKHEMMKRGNADWFMNASSALKMGIVDHIGVPYVASYAPPMIPVTTFYLPDSAIKTLKQQEKLNKNAKTKKAPKKKTIKYNQLKEGELS
jgi:ATP-dependent Clp protease protease subunit